MPIMYCIIHVNIYFVSFFIGFFIGINAIVGKMIEIQNFYIIIQLTCANLFIGAYS